MNIKLRIEGYMVNKEDIPRLIDAVDRFSNLKVLVIGDVMLDEFVWGKVNRISPEAPVPVVDVIDETLLLGGAANVINNIISAGANAILAGLVGDDSHGRRITRMLEEKGCDAGGVIVDSDRPTTIKTRVVAQGQQVVRFDREKRAPISDAVKEKLIQFLRGKAGKVDAVIISDYGKGLITEELIKEVNRLFNGPGRIVAVDPKVQNFNLYREVTVLTPNHHEAAQGAGVVIENEDDLDKAGRKIIEDLNCNSVLITRGEQGMTLYERDGSKFHIPTAARKVFDVTGAGDTVIAILVLGRAAGLSRHDAAILSNFAAGVVVGEVGTSAVTAEGLKKIVAASAQ